MSVETEAPPRIEVPDGEPYPKLYIGGPGLALRLWEGDEFHRVYDNFGCLAATHMWDGFCDPVEPTEFCQPTALGSDLRCHEHYYDEPGRKPCYCVGDLVYRGFCRHCDWEGPITLSQREAIEDAHDHAWPGWREMPVVPACRRGGTSKSEKAAHAKWMNTFGKLYPEGWLEQGGPIRVPRRPMATRPVYGYGPFGGYELCGIERDDAPI